MPRSPLAAKLTLTALEDRTVPATVTVTNLDDTTAAGDGVSLREAVQSINRGAPANADVVPAGSFGDGDAIVFAPRLAGATILVNNADPLSDFGPSAFAITKSLRIDGDAASGVTIARNAAAAGSLRLFNVLPGGSLTLTNLTLLGGLAQGGSGADGGGGAAGMGGAIFNRGALVLTAVTLTENAAVGGKGGAGSPVYDIGGGGGGVGGNATGAVPLQAGDGGGPNGGHGEPTLSVDGGFGGGGGGGRAGNERAGNGGFGGGGGNGYGGGGSFGGYGGGGGAGVRKAASVFGGGTNPTTGFGDGGGGAGLGGAIFNAAGSVRLTNVTLGGNSASGGAAGGTLDQVQAGASLGGAVFTLNGSVTVVCSTFANNSLGRAAGAAPAVAPGGADIYSHQFAGSVAPNGKGTNVPGIGSPATLSVQNSILASSDGGASVVNDGGMVPTDSTGNVTVQDTLGSGFTATDLSKLGLGALANNGGPVLTVAIAATSAARNAGTNPARPEGNVDARGESRPDDGSPIDAGAYQAKDPQVISFALGGPVTYGAAPITLTATGGKSDDPVTFALVSGPGRIDGDTLVVTGAGDIVVLATQAGDTRYAAGMADATLKVSKAVLTYTADRASRAYGSAGGTLTGTVSGFVNGDTLASATAGSLTFTTAAGPQSMVGKYPISGGGLMATNYTLAQAPDNAGALTVTRAPLTVQAQDATRVYGSADAPLPFGVLGLVAGDTLERAITGRLAAPTGAGVGQYPITLGTLAAANYAITLVPATLTVAPAPLTIRAASASRAQGAPNPALGADYFGLVNGDGPAVVTGLVVSTAAGADSPPGAYPVAASSASAANYSITYEAGTLTVTAAGAGASGGVSSGAPSPVAGARFAVGTGGGGLPGAALFDSAGRAVATFSLPIGFAGEVRVASADFNGDGLLDLVAATGPGVMNLVRILDGRTAATLFEVRPFEDSFFGGVSVAAGDITGDGVPDLVVGADVGGGPRVRVLRGGDYAVVADFYGIDDPAFRGGVRVAVGDVSGDGRADLVVGAGLGGGPRVTVYDGALLGPGGGPKLFDFLAFEPGLRDGVYVAAGDIDGDGRAEVVVGAGAGGGPRVTAFSGAGAGGGAATPVADFFAGDPEGRAGVKVAARDVDGDGLADIVAAPGSGPGARVAVYPAQSARTDPAAGLALDPYPGLSGGVYVG